MSADPRLLAAHQASIMMHPTLRVIGAGSSKFLFNYPFPKYNVQENDLISFFDDKSDR